MAEVLPFPADNHLGDLVIAPVGDHLVARYVDGDEVNLLIASADLRALEKPERRAAFDALCRDMVRRRGRAHQRRAPGLRLM